MKDSVWMVVFSMVFMPWPTVVHAVPVSSDIGGKEGALRDATRTPVLEPDELPAFKVRGVTPELGRYLTVFYASGSRLTPGASIVGIPYLREIRGALLDQSVEGAGGIDLPASSFSRTSQNRVNWLILLGSDEPLGALMWSNADGSCPAGVGVCSPPRDAVSMAILPAIQAINQARSSGGVLDVTGLMRKLRRGPGN
jgi:hypothetical protein